MKLNMNNFDALTFDVYGTLIDWEPTIISMFHSTAEQHGVELSRDQLLMEFDKARAALQRIRPALLYPDVLRESYRQFCASYGMPVNDQECEVYANSVMLWPTFEDTRNAMATLQKRYKIGLLSNIDNTSIQFSERKLGIKADVIVTAENVNAYKPDHAHFESAFEAFAAMGIPKERILHVGQSLRADVIPANQLGISCVWIKRPGRSLGSRPEDAQGAKADLELDTMRELALYHVAQQALL
ncbi:HAD family hydrolase [Herbaspirillum chlorophenolicum]|jgi:2-haloalkanoic acid dehalogenase type II|uniref:HAD family hydrolase n=1 Tax=Herbaspirillum chlorophenolicum TaxID=211589 RepID=UPI00067AFFC3|nr:HAD hydrolase-like protein [Herbaspirillum chlorophenolicum]